MTQAQAYLIAAVIVAVLSLVQWPALAGVVGLLLALWWDARRKGR